MRTRIQIRNILGEAEDNFQSDISDGFRELKRHVFFLSHRIERSYAVVRIEHRDTRIGHGLKKSPTNQIVYQQKIHLGNVRISISIGRMRKFHVAPPRGLKVIF